MVLYLSIIFMISYFDQKPQSPDEPAIKPTGGVAEVIKASEEVTSEWVSEGLKPGTVTPQPKEEPAKPKAK